MSERDRNYPPLKYFKRSEFDCPCEKGSGENMDAAFLQKLDKCRELAGIPFKINSGFRCKEYNEGLLAKGYKASKTSPHLKGLAADIATPTSSQRWKVLESAIKIGFNRIGIGKNFIHLDIDTEKSQEVVWHYY